MTTNQPRIIAALMGDHHNPFWTGMESDYHRLGPDMGLTVQCHYASPEQDPGAQAAELARLGGQDYQLIIINPLNQSCLAREVLNLAQKGIKLLDVGSKTARSLVAEAGSNYVPVKTVDFEEQGRVGGGRLGQLLPAGSEVALLGGRPTAAQSVGRLVGALKALEEAGALVAAQAFADFDEEQGSLVAGEILAAHPDLAGFFCANDLMALGAARAARAAGRPEVLCVGVDLIPQAITAIAKGELAASVAFSRAEVAKQVLTAALASLAGEPWPDRYCVNSRLATRENLAEFGG